MTEDLSVREAVIERYLVQRLQKWAQENKSRVKIKKVGGPGWRGWPDRFVMFVDTPVLHWIELKRPKGGRFEPLQLRCHRELKRFGQRVFVLNTKVRVDAYIKALELLDPAGLTDL